MPQLIDIVVWRKAGAQFSAYSGVQVYIYEIGTTTAVALKLEDGVTPVALPIISGPFGNVTVTGAPESATERVYLAGGSQQADVRVVDSANGIDQTFYSRDVGIGTLVLSVDAPGVGAIVGGKTFGDMQSEIAQYIGGPASQRFKDLAATAINQATDFLNQYQFARLASAANITLQAAAVRYAPPPLWGAEMPDILAAVLTEDLLNVASPICFLSWPDFFAVFKEKTGDQGLPSFYTYDPQGDQILFDMIPGSGNNGRVVRIPYFRRIPAMSAAGDTLGVDLGIEAILKEQAIPRVKRLNRDADWMRDDTYAMAKLQVFLASQPSIDHLSLGL